MQVPFVEAVASILLFIIWLPSYRTLWINGELEDYFHPHTSFSLFVTTITWLTVLIEARASPRKPNVWIVFKSSSSLSLLVVYRSQRIGKSSFYWLFHVLKITKNQYLDSISIILDLHLFQSTFTNRNNNICCVSVYAIFNHFLQCRSRSLNNFTSSNFIHYFFW